MHFNIIAAVQCLLLISADGGVDLGVEEERLHSPGEGLGAEVSVKLVIRGPTTDQRASCPRH